MRVERWIPDASPEAVFDRIIDFESYPRYADAIHSVRTETGPAGELHSHWRARFRNGIAEWSEVDSVDRGARQTCFEQTTGDFAHFSGAWRVTSYGAGALVVFEAEFDMGMPSLAELVNPVAERALSENIAQLIDGFAAAEGTAVAALAGTALAT
jgi:ribosome-associated toxin RatA of RatAB toxin-antitoxin module